MSRDRIRSIASSGFHPLFLAVFLCGTAAQGQDAGDLSTLSNNGTTRNHKLVKPYQHRPDRFYDLRPKKLPPAKKLNVLKPIQAQATPLPTVPPILDKNGKPVTFWPKGAPKNVPSLYGDKPLFKAPGTP
ncbi:MAG TPA: hypothetical protein VMV05_09520 [bacterium]|nr:hypothetical protein [bacterium]